MSDFVRRGDRPKLSLDELGEVKGCQVCCQGKMSQLSHAKASQFGKDFCFFHVLKDVLNSWKLILVLLGLVVDRTIITTLAKVRWLSILVLFSYHDCNGSTVHVLYIPLLIDIWPSIDCAYKHVRL